MTFFKLDHSLLALIVLAAAPLQAELWVVPDDVDDIQSGLNASQPGDTVLAREGLYEEILDFNGRDIVLASLFLVDGDPEHIANTIIDPGDRAGSIVSFLNGESPEAKLIGFTLTGGSGINGGAVNIVRSSPTLWDLVISGCEAVFEGGGGMGGGIYASGSPSIERVHISDCRAAYGAGLVLRDGQATVSYITVTNCEGTGIDRSPSRSGGVMILSGTYVLEHCNISNNISHGGGAGVYTASATTTFFDCLIQNNRALDAGGTGGGLSLQNNSVNRLERCLITGNSATTNGGGITMYLARADLVNCTIYGNVAETAGSAIYQFTNCRVVSCNSIIAHNGEGEGAITFVGGNESSFTAIYSCIPGGAEGIVTNEAGRVNWLDGNMEDDPLLALANEGDFHLIAESPCIDAGIDFYEYEGRQLVALDDNQYDGDMPDMGMFEFTEDPGEGVALEPLPHGIKVMEAWPNPFNSATTIRYDLNPKLTRGGGVAIYDPDGRLIDRIQANLNLGGVGRLVWDATDKPAGVYFARIPGDREGRSLRLVLVK